MLKFRLFTVFSFLIYILSFQMLKFKVLIQLNLKQQLTSSGYNILGSFHSGKDAIEACLIYKPDLAIVDIDLQGSLSGLDTARAICKITAVILITASPEPDIIQSMNETGCKYLLKPFEPEVLQQLIVSVLSHNIL